MMGYTEQDIERMMEAVEFAKEVIWSPSGQATTKALQDTYDFLDGLLVEGRI